MSEYSFLKYKDYEDFWLKRVSSNGQPMEFSNYEVLWAITETENKYFGEYELTDSQKAAIDILIWCAQEKLK